MLAGSFTPPAGAPGSTVRDEVLRLPPLTLFALEDNQSSACASARTHRGEPGPGTYTRQYGADTVASYTLGQIPSAKTSSAHTAARLKARRKIST
jgi:hypothetical protein